MICLTSAFLFFSFFLPSHQHHHLHRYRHRQPLPDPPPRISHRRRVPIPIPRSCGLCIRPQSRSAFDTTPRCLLFPRDPSPPPSSLHSPFPSGQARFLPCAPHAHSIRHVLPTLDHAVVHAGPLG